MKIILTVAGFVLLSGCSSFDGRPSPVLSMNSLVTIVEKQYLPITVIQNYNSKVTALEKRAYRDEALFAYLSAADARYRNYLIGLSKQAKGGNLALDVVALGLTSGVSIAGESTGQALGAGATFLSGSQGKLNQRLFYEQTLPALVAIMESERSKVRAEIFEKMTADKNPLRQFTYGITEMLNDVARYEGAPSIERAVVRLSQNAAEDLTSAEANEFKATEERSNN